MNELRFDLDNRSLKAQFIPPDHPDMKYLLFLYPSSAGGSLSLTD